MNLATILTESAQRDADHTALKLDDVEVTYGALDDGSARVAAVLAEKGVKPGDRVGIMLPNVPYFPIVYYGILRAGAVVVPMNVLLKAREVAFYLARPRGQPRLRLARLRRRRAEGRRRGRRRVRPRQAGRVRGAARRPGARTTDVVDRDDDDTAVILYTSGTTGTPKGAELTHANLRRNVEIAVSLFALESDAVVLGALPLFHSFGQTCGMNASVCAGATLTLIPRFDPGKALEIIQRDKVTVFEGVPTMYGAMLNHPDKRQLRHVQPRGVRVGRRGHARRADARLRGGLRLQGARGLRPVGDVTGRLVQPPRQGAQGRARSARRSRASR